MGSASRKRNLIAYRGALAEMVPELLDVQPALCSLYLLPAFKDGPTVKQACCHVIDGVALNSADSNDCSTFTPIYTHVQLTGVGRGQVDVVHWQPKEHSNILSVKGGSGRLKEEIPEETFGNYTETVFLLSAGGINSGIPREMCLHHFLQSDLRT